jgi:hypothetical protein
MRRRYSPQELATLAHWYFEEKKSLGAIARKVKRTKAGINALVNRINYDERTYVRPSKGATPFGAFVPTPFDTYVLPADDEAQTTMRIRNTISRKVDTRPAIEDSAEVRAQATRQAMVVAARAILNSTTLDPHVKVEAVKALL